jgi:hypothetical protein
MWKLCTFKWDFCWQKQFLLVATRLRTFTCWHYKLQYVLVRGAGGGGILKASFLITHTKDLYNPWRYRSPNSTVTHQYQFIWRILTVLRRKLDRLGLLYEQTSVQDTQISPAICTKGPKQAGTATPDDGNRYSFRNVVHRITLVLSKAGLLYYFMWCGQRRQYLVCMRSIWSFLHRLKNE